MTTIWWQHGMVSSLWLHFDDNMAPLPWQYQQHTINTMTTINYYYGYILTTFWCCPHGNDDNLPHSDEEGPAPRLCILHLWPDFQGYGFNLHAEKGKPGQFIGKVDDDSPSSDAGLREGDRICEVNGVSVLEENHAQVVTRIKAQPGTVSLLVIDQQGEEYYKARGIVVNHDMPNVIRGETRDKSAPPAPTEQEPEPIAVPVVAAAVHAEQNGKIWSYFSNVY